MTEILVSTYFNAIFKSYKRGAQESLSSTLSWHARGEQVGVTAAQNTFYKIIICFKRQCLLKSHTIWT